MTCMHNRDEQCFEDCPDCERARYTTICTGCQQAIRVGEDCYYIDDNLYCSDCAEDVVDEHIQDMPFKDKLELVSGERTTWEG